MLNVLKPLTVRKVVFVPVGIALIKSVFIEVLSCTIRLFIGYIVEGHNILVCHDYL